MTTELREPPNSVVPVHIPNSSVLELLEERARTLDGTVHFTGTGKETTLSQLLESARALGERLVTRGVMPGAAVGLIGNVDGDHLTAILGVWYARAVPVPLPVPFTGMQQYTRHVRAMVTTAGAELVLVGDDLFRARARLSTAIPAPVFATISEIRAERGARPGTEPTAGARAGFVQFTSGTTGPPKPVHLDQSRILAGVRALSQALGTRSTDIGAIALPLYHDMGMFGTLQCLMYGSRTVLSPPQQFLRDPFAWLRTVAAERATIVPLPKFMLSVLAAAPLGESAAGIDLSSVLATVVATENTGVSLLERVAARLSPLGLSPDTFVSAYGMAEATAAVSMTAVGGGAPVRYVDRGEIDRTGRAREVPSAWPTARPLFSVGEPVPGVRVRVMGKDGSALPGQVGGIEVSGLSVALGNNLVPHAGDGWVRTGDLGFREGEEIFLVGRESDTIVCGGLRHFAEDVEQIVAGLPGVAEGRCAAVPDRSADRTGTGVAVVVETSLPPVLRTVLADIVRESLAERLGCVAVRLWCVGRRRLPQTSSGKWRRAAVAAELESGAYGPPVDGAENTRRQSCTQS